MIWEKFHMDEFIEELPGQALRIGIKVLIAIVVLLVGIWVIKIIRKILRKGLTKAKAEKGVITFLDSLTKFILYIVLIFILLNEFGFQTGSIVALLGSFGVTIGLALQGSLSNLAGGVLILILKPFKVGDYIHEDTHGNEGSVSEISMFYTKLITPDERVVVLPNGALANTSLVNFTTIGIRRLDLVFDIAYSSDINLAKKVITEVFTNYNKKLEGREISVFVDGLADSSVKIGARLYISKEYYWDAKWTLTEEVKKALDDHGIEIPFLQVDVHER